MTSRYELKEATVPYLKPLIQHLRGEIGAPGETSGRTDPNLLRFELGTSGSQFKASLVDRLALESLL
jgi:hypothetical protein